MKINIFRPKIILIFAFLISSFLSCGVEKKNYCIADSKKLELEIVSKSAKNSSLEKLSVANKNMISYVKKHAKQSIGLCWTYVQRAYNYSRGIKVGKISLPGNSGDNIERLQKLGFCKSSNKRLEDAPIGSILIYRPGKCNAHTKYGHGEIKVGKNKYCSDFCWNYNGKNGFKSKKCEEASEIMIPRELNHPDCG